MFRSVGSELVSDYVTRDNVLLVCNSAGKISIDLIKSVAKLRGHTHMFVHISMGTERKRKAEIFYVSATY